MIIELNEKQHQILKTNAANGYRSAAKELKLMLEKAFGTTRFDDESNKYKPDTLTRVTPYGLQQTDIKAPPAVVNRFFLKKDEFNKDVFNVEYFTIDGIKQLLQENYATKQEFNKYLKIKIVELNIIKETIQDLESWRGDDPMVDLIIDDIIKFLKS